MGFGYGLILYPRFSAGGLALVGIISISD